MMKLFLVLAALAAAANAATITDPADCTSYPCLIFDDDFEFLDLEAWEHEMTLAGGGNWEFQAYVNNRSISYTHDSTLFIKPGLTADYQSEDFLTTGTWDMWGSQGKNEHCTGNGNYGCERSGYGGMINPIMSARLRTLPFFAAGDAKVEIRAKMPRGDWLWPALWMMPKDNAYGLWPASGEVDINEARGNINYGTLGCEYGAQTLHWGPNWLNNAYIKTHTEYQAAAGTTFADDFHTYGFERDSSSMTFYVDGNQTMKVEPKMSFWDYGGFNTTSFDNPWKYASDMAPFDQKFFLILNLAVGGTNGFFPDDVTATPAKPWTNTESTAAASFWGGKADWYPTWTNGTDTIQETAALQVDYVKVWKMS